jgi:hypothetical protein
MTQRLRDSHYGNGLHNSPVETNPTPDSVAGEPAICSSLSLISEPVLPFINHTSTGCVAGNRKFQDPACSLVVVVSIGTSGVASVVTSAARLPAILADSILQPLGNFSSASRLPNAGWINNNSFVLVLSNTSSVLRFTVLIGSVIFSHSKPVPVFSTLQVSNVTVSSFVPGLPSSEPKRTPCGKMLVLVHVITSPAKVSRKG